MSRKSAKSPQELRWELSLDMLPATQELAKEIEQKLRHAELVSTLANYDIGKRIAEAVQREGDFGARAIEQIARFVAIPGGTRRLYELRQLVKMFTRHFVKDQASRTLDNGRPFSLDHFLVLMTVRSKREQERLIEKVRREGLTARQLQREIGE